MHVIQDGLQKQHALSRLECDIILFSASSFSSLRIFAQVAQSCRMLEMHADIKPAAGTADDYDFAVVGAQEAVAALRQASAYL